MDHLKEEAARIRSVAEFKDWTRSSLRRVFPHGTLGCGYGRIHAGGVGIDGIIAVDYPVDHLANICNAAGGLDTPILRRWLATREPQLFEAARPWADTPAAWLEKFISADMRNAAAHAVYDSERCIGTYHSFHRIPGRLGPGHASQLREIVPMLHEVICRLIGDLRSPDDRGGPLEALSVRERQILALVGQGRANADIAQALFISEVTVKHHMTRIFGKLGVSNRMQLLRLAIENESRSKNRLGMLVL